MLSIAIDGACRRNGKPTCVSAGGIFIAQYDSDLNISYMTTMSCSEARSTNQRGELGALLLALDYARLLGEDAQIITDSEYLFNACTKEWLKRWDSNGWVTASGDPVKNKDLWLRISDALIACAVDDLEILMYHIKGHTLYYNKRRAIDMLQEDSSGRSLYDELMQRYNAKKNDIYSMTAELFIKNNGFALTEEVLQRFAVANTMADAIATKAVEEANLLCDM